MWSVWHVVWVEGGREGGREGVPGIGDIEPGGRFHTTDVLRDVETVKALARNFLEGGREGGREGGEGMVVRSGYKKGEREGRREGGREGGRTYVPQPFACDFGLLSA